jgi:transcriptional regulator with PAS, ATPase and Fis domain
MPRIGILSPYPEFSHLAEAVAAELGLAVQSVHAVLDEAVAVARAWEADRTVDAVIARGLTARLLQQELTRLPVIAIAVTGYDVIKALHQAHREGSRISYIDYDDPARPFDLGEVREILGFGFTARPYRTRVGLLRRLAEARRDGDAVVTTAAVSQSAGWTTMVPSSPAAIREALLEAQAVLARHRREEVQGRRVTAVLESSREGIIVMDGRGRVTVFNPSAERILGLPAPEVLGKPAGRVSDPAFAAVCKGDGEVQTVDGRQLVVSRVPIVVAGEQAGVVITFQSASTIVRLEEKIRRELHTKGLAARYDFRDIVGRSRALTATVERARKYARSDLTVLITGESGTGKELFAHAIHRHSPRAEGAFVAVNCAALPESLLESELFGYEEGAFTGARKGGKPGLFELAHGGTIFLDEIGELPVPLQARLLRVLQGREVMRIGGERLIPVNVRVIAATNRDLSAAAREGQFRDDLFYRLSVLSLHVPPLRERPEDIPLLAEQILRTGPPLGVPPVTLPPASLQALAACRWPGNVRELRNFLLRFLILAAGEEHPELIFGRLLEEERGAPRPGPAADGDHLVVRIATMEEMEQQIIVQLDERQGYDRTELARLLGLSRTTVWKKLKEAGAGALKN